MTPDPRDYRDDERSDDDIGARHRRELDVADLHDAPWVCQSCGHHRRNHSWAGPCLVIVPEVRIRPDGSTESLRVYCPCRGVER